MDLSEIGEGGTSRHPWELARARAIISVLARRGTRFQSILDYGCGDGFTGQEVQRSFGAGALVGVDIHLPDAACGVRSLPGATQELLREEAALAERRFELLLLCDVIEHVPDDRALVEGLVARRLTPGGHVVVTVPAFQALFSDHDRALRHYRRYTLRGLRQVLGDSGLELVEGGYLFASLLAPRALTRVKELALGSKESGEHGVGRWSGSPLLTRALSAVFAAENAALLGACRWGLTVPGLSAWALCKKP